MSPAIFLDRDGVLIEDSGYVHKLSDVFWLPQVKEGLYHLKKNLGFKLIVITNQSGIARGYFEMKDVDSVHQYLQNDLNETFGVEFNDFYVCPHHPTEGVEPYKKVCTCRKPGTFLVDQAVQDHQIDIHKSFFLGDKPSDLECAINSGVNAVFIPSKNKSSSREGFEGVMKFSGVAEFSRSISD